MGSIFWVGRLLFLKEEIEGREVDVRRAPSDDAEQITRPSRLHLLDTSAFSPSRGKRQALRSRPVPRRERRERGGVFVFHPPVRRLLFQKEEIEGREMDVRRVCLRVMPSR